MDRIFLSWTGRDQRPVRLAFASHQQNDAFVRFSERVVELDRDPHFDGAYVRLEREGNSTAFAHWTKTSNESPTAEGEPA